MIIPLPSGGATGAGGGGGGKCPPMIFDFVCLFVCFWLLAQLSVMAMIVPLPPYLIFWTNFEVGQKCVGVPTPPPPHTHTHPPLSNF